MKDLHTHALSSIDDGAHSIKESISMLEESFRQGVSVCALTPHCLIHTVNDIDIFLSKRSRRFEDLLNHTKDKEIPNLILGAEVYADHDISVNEGLEKLCLGNSKYILLELPFMKKYGWFAECVHSLNIRGITVIVAHIDRYPEWENIISELKGLRVVYEINADKFLTFRGRKRARKIIQYGKNYIISSDMHNTTTRKTNIKKAFEMAEKIDTEFSKSCNFTIKNFFS